MYNEYKNKKDFNYTKLFNRCLLVSNVLAIVINVYGLFVFKYDETEKAVLLNSQVDRIILWVMIGTLALLQLIGFSRSQLEAIIAMKWTQRADEKVAETEQKVIDRLEEKFKE